MSTTGVVFVNVGTPDAPRTEEVGRYLREFLMDPHVVDIPWVARWILVNALIVPRRSHKSAELYRKIWTSNGSPLLLHTVNLAKEVQAVLGPSYLVQAAMRYGNPSIRSVLTRFAADGVGRVVVFPLYPQYSLAATETSILEFKRLGAELLPQVPMAFVPPFYARSEYLNAVAEVSRPHLTSFDRVLFSFHGLPERQVKKTASSHCLRAPGCCDAVTGVNQNCYRAQSFATARSLAALLDLPQGTWEVGFQSRLGRTPWIRPFSDEIYETLPAKGVKKLAVLTPSFVADCLETLEEVQLRGEEAFRKAGGESLKLVPSLNTHQAWVKAAAKLVATALPA